MSMTVPSTWKFHSSQSNGNSVTFTRPGHTVQQPRLAIISRVVPVYDTKRQDWSVPQYRVRILDGIMDADGNPDPTKTLADVTFRCSLDNNGAAQGSSVVADLLVVINQADAAATFFESQDFPQVASA